ncbi:hypothetical protein CFC21_038030 [Triticum aestivum]|uniref:Uncharacterized protein n=3 Tax=Triticum aestivum TaxID=4565 RepID=A0A3B6ES19_WHEAT|nr:hypothetical protein CFC21_038030 [Triticum aestivum]
MAQGEMSRAETMNIDELENLMATKLTYYRSIYKDHEQRRKLCIIFRVPKHIKQVDKLSYEPKVMSIGPYYHGNSSLQFMEKVKWNCLDYVLKLNCGKKLEVYLTMMESLEKQARSCYSEEVSLESDMFLRMLLLDGCFVLVYLGGTNDLNWCVSEQNACGSNYQGGEPLQYTIAQPEEITEHASNEGTRTESMRLIAGTSSDLCSTESVELGHISTGEQCYDRKDPDQPKCDPISEWHHAHVFRDLLLLENQLPFSIVKRIYGLLVGHDAVDLLTEKVRKYLELNIQKYTTIARNFDGQTDFHHLLHLCHMYFRPQQRIQPEQHCQIRNRWLHPLTTLWHTYYKRSYFEELSINQQASHISSCQTLNRWRQAEQYHEAGIEFKCKEHNKHNPPSLLDITFDKGEVEIPCLLIDENTICLFRNLVAFEQTCSQYGNDVTSYIAFMSQLVSTPCDVALLARKGIILHHMRTDEEVSTLFSKLGKNVDFDQNGAHYLKSVCRMMKEYYQNCVNRWMAWLWHNHLKNPWLVLVVVAAAIVLLCTIIQSLLSLLAYLDQTTGTN